MSSSNRARQSAVDSLRLWTDMQLGDRRIPVDNQSLATVSFDAHDRQRYFHCSIHGKVIPYFDKYDCQKCPATYDPSVDTYPQMTVVVGGIVTLNAS